MFNFFKKHNPKVVNTQYILSSSGKKKSIFDIFRIDLFILLSLFLLTFCATFLYIEISTNNKLIVNRETELAKNYSLIQDYSKTIGFLNGLKTQKFEGKNVINILSFLNEINLYEYELSFEPTKKYFFVSLKSISQDELPKFIDLGKKLRVLNIYKTNETIRIKEEGRVSILLIFN